MSSMLREKMIRDMEIHGLSELTQKAYIRHLKNLAQFHQKSPDGLSLEDIYQYQYHITNEKNYSWSYFNQAVCAMKFLYGFTLKKGWDLTHIPYQKKSRKLPEVLNKEEILNLLKAIEDTRDKTIVYLLYSAGLRVSELTHLKVSNIDSNRMVIHVKQGKGKKDRYVILAKNLLDVLRQYWIESKPNSYLFPGVDVGKPICRATVNFLLKKICKSSRHN